jgi:hypothetical protein
MAEMIEVMRNEKKYIVSLQNYRLLNSHFEKILHADPYNREGGYMVRSLYFDSYSNMDFHEKIDGLEHRKKIRLRIYDPKDQTVKLEMKQKSGSYQLKQSLLISKEEAVQLTRGVYSVLLNYDSELARKIYFLMNSEYYTPKSLVEYKRTAYVLPENSIRLNFDANIKASESNLDLFSDDLNLSPIFYLDNVVFEVKYNHFLLSYIKDVISSCNKIETACSKYCLSRSLV